jgi:hypothetical protein
MSALKRAPIAWARVRTIEVCLIDQGRRESRRSTRDEESSAAIYTKSRITIETKAEAEAEAEKRKL